MRIREEIKTPAEGLKTLLEKYAVSVPAYELKDGVLTVEGSAVPLLTWRYERRFVEMKRMIEDGTVGEAYQIRCNRTAARTETLDGTLYRELDLCLWWSEKKAENVFAVSECRCANVIMRLSGGSICIIEAAAQLEDDVTPIERHEVITGHGMCTDQTVDTQVRQQSVYVFAEGQPAAEYTDVDFELYGLNMTDAALVHAAYDALTNPEVIAQIRRQDALLRMLVDAVHQSAQTASVAEIREV